MPPFKIMAMHMEGARLPFCPLLVGGHDSQSVSRYRLNTLKVA